MSSITAQLPFERLQYALNNTVALLWCSMAASEAKLVIGDQTGLLQYWQHSAQKERIASRLIG